ncbi:MAG: glycosyltransferase family 1 protein [bacterium]|nr:glycosyltransferase family 1 protein [bacterium]
MIIGVDAGALAVTDERLKVGVYRVTSELLKTLTVLDEKNDYRLYSFRPIEQGIMDTLGRRMTNVVLAPSTGWLSVRLPIELMRKPVDIFLGLSQALPQNSSYNIGFVYDVGFLHQPENYHGAAPKLRKQTEVAVSRSDHIITISHASKSDLVNAYPGVSAKISVAYPGVSHEFKPGGDVFRPSRPYFLTVGSLSKVKNIPTLIRAFARCIKTMKVPYSLILAGGDYWKNPEIMRTIEETDASRFLSLPGYIPDSELPAYYRGARAFVTVSPYEGFCLPVVEAMACGCPVIGARSGGTAEVIGDAGICIDPFDEARIADALFTLAQDQKTRDRLRLLGLKRSRLFSWNAFGTHVLNKISSYEH